jgi:hypothetical protein
MGDGTKSMTTPFVKEWMTTTYTATQELRRE